MLGLKNNCQITERSTVSGPCTFFLACFLFSTRFGDFFCFLIVPSSTVHLTCIDYYPCLWKIQMVFALLYKVKRNWWPLVNCPCSFAVKRRVIEFPIKCGLTDQYKIDILWPFALLYLEEEPCCLQMFETRGTPCNTMHCRIWEWLNFQCKTNCLCCKTKWLLFSVTVHFLWLWNDNVLWF